MRRKWLKCIVAFFILLICILIIYNFKYNCSDFLKTNAISCLSIVIAIGVSFFIVQRQTDLRKQKDIFIKLLESLKELIDDEKSYDFTRVEKEEMLMRTRNISLKIDTIKYYSKRFNIKDIAFLEEKFLEYQSVIDNHSTNMELLRQLNKELKRPLDLISQRIFEIMLNLYN